MVDEMIFAFTHDIVMGWMLPGIGPTSRRVEVTHGSRPITGENVFSCRAGFGETRVANSTLGDDINRVRESMRGDLKKIDREMSSMESDKGQAPGVQG